MDLADVLHQRFNPRSDHIPPVRIKRFKRHDLSKLLAEFGLTKGVEVGVADGIHALDLCQTIPGIDFIGVDPYMKYHWKHSAEEHERCFQEATEKLRPFSAKIIRATSMDAVRTIPDGSLDWVYIDGNHEFDFAMQDLIEWSKKVRTGGMVSGHDYYRFRGAGVVEAVDAYTHAHQIHEWYVCDEHEVDFFWAKS